MTQKKQQRQRQAMFGETHRDNFVPKLLNRKILRVNPPPLAKHAIGG